MRSFKSGQKVYVAPSKTRVKVLPRAESSKERRSAAHANLARFVRHILTLEVQNEDKSRHMGKPKTWKKKTRDASFNFFQGGDQDLHAKEKMNSKPATSLYHKISPGFAYEPRQLGRDLLSISV